MTVRVLLINKSIGMMRGGGETRTLRFAAGLRERGIEVELLYNRPLTGDVRYPVRELPVREVRAPYLRDLSYRLPRGRGVTVRLEEHLFNAAALREIVRGERPDVILSFGLFGLAAAARRRLGVPVVVANSGGLPHPSVSRSLSQIDAIIADGHDLEAFPRAFGLHPVEVRKGVDTERFRPHPPGTDPLAHAEHEPRLLFVGRLVPVKDVPNLLAAVSLLRERGRMVQLTLVGEGSLRSGLEIEARELGLGGRVTFTGHLAGDELARAYRDHDLFVLASTFDNFPNAVLEAMASRLPVVATRVGGIPEQVIEGETGLLVPSRDPGRLARAIESLLDDPSTARAMGEAGRRRVVESFDWDHGIDRLAALLTDLVGSGSADAVENQRKRVLI
jgi:glycosyltransferase involved in cell wall biosynthesis